ncbi:Chemotaxis protein PomA [Posidoniimonas polymericola]|uniref:Chemotaxis protein PomA n=1 Tax=Posidoniimonas polymericola TaxID=2528002 RepID=A0A5C5YQN6_9BACT|nr:motility protein A [Posidoniimonas polymericola]TWT77226.1 Chemotaxis protein PomA [Posidoniimonas polymericola]
MDIASSAGVVIAIVLILVSIVLGGGSFGAFIDPASVMVVIGGAIAATLISYPLKNFLSVFGVSMKVFLYKLHSTQDVITQLVSLAETARRDGLLALEGRVAEIEHPFIVLGIQMAVDGARPEVMEDIMRTEMDAVATRHRDGKGLLDCMGRFAPAFGMIGTLMGLIIMLGDMSDPSKIGAGMAVALLTTLYGAIASNVVFLPFAEKLGFTNKQELLTMEIIVRGIMAIQSGENPRIIEQKLNTFIPPKQRVTEEEAA